MTPRRIVVIAPHSDDAELGVGGYVAREIEARRATADFYVLAQGTASHTHHPVALPSRREAEGMAGAYLLGASCAFVGAAPDSEFNSTPMGEIVGAVEDILFPAPIDDLFFPLPSFHEDHAVTHRAVIAALRPHLHRQFPTRAFCYEYPANFWGVSPPEWGRVYAPIEEGHLERKLAALSLHKSQWVSHSDSLFGPRGVRALAEMRGLECGSPFAELFYTLRGMI